MEKKKEKESRKLSLVDRMFWKVLHCFAVILK